MFRHVHGGADISCQPPDAYAGRFRAFIDRVLVAPASAAEGEKGDRRGRSTRRWNVRRRATERTRGYNSTIDGATTGAAIKTPRLTLTRAKLWTTPARSFGAPRAIAIAVDRLLVRTALGRSRRTPGRASLRAAQRCSPFTRDPPSRRPRPARFARAPAAPTEVRLPVRMCPGRRPSSMRTNNDRLSPRDRPRPPRASSAHPPSDRLPSPLDLRRPDVAVAAAPRAARARAPARPPLTCRSRRPRRTRARSRPSPPLRARARSRALAAARHSRRVRREPSRRGRRRGRRPSGFTWKGAKIVPALISVAVGLVIQFVVPCPRGGPRAWTSSPSSSPPSPVSSSLLSPSAPGLSAAFP